MSRKPALVMMPVTAPADGVITATEATEASLEEASVYTHGTTLGLNAILERKGAAGVVDALRTVIFPLRSS